MPDFTKWTRAKGPSAGLVQEHFVKRRLAELDRIGTKIEERMKERIEKFYNDINAPLEPLEWIKVYDRITDRLQKSQLTINFHASSWFSTVNDYESYTQMYERAKTIYNPATKSHQTFLQNSGLNPAAVRAGADDKVTFPKNWAGQTQTQRGLSPGTRSGGSIMNQMAFGTHKTVTRPVKFGDSTMETGIVSDNQRFNPQTKQLFAALNYGNCPNGGAPSYGDSFLVLEDHFKLNAIYFGSDTFSVAMNKSPAKEQIPYHNLGAILGTQDARLMSLYLLQGTILTKTHASNAIILEAHLFTDLPFAGNIKEVVLAESDTSSDIAENARTFAKKHGAKLFFTTS